MGSCMWESCSCIFSQARESAAAVQVLSLRCPDMALCPLNENDCLGQAGAPPECLPRLLLGVGCPGTLPLPPSTHLRSGHGNADDGTSRGGWQGRGAERGPLGKARSLTPWLSLACLPARRAKVKKGVNILGTRTSEPRQWDVKQELGNGGKHATTTVLCQRLGSGARNR